MLRHPGLDWQTASQKLQKNPDILKAARAMEESGGEPDLVVFPDGSCAFCERRYDAVFTFHNGAESYYSVRGFRGYYPL